MPFHFSFPDPEHRIAAVRLLHSVAGYRRPPSFERGEDGRFELAFDAPMVRRIEYELELTDRHGQRSITIDPHNPHHVLGPFGRRSVLMARGYAEPLEVGPPPAAARGRLETIPAPIGRSDSGEIVRGRALLWNPPGFGRRDPLPVILVLDGPEYVRYAALRNVLENLLDRGRIPPVRALLVPPAERSRQYSADPGFPAVLAEALPATLAAHVKLPAGELRWRLGLGASLGALALLHAHAEQPGLFGGLVLQSGSYFRPQSDQQEREFPWYGRITDLVGAIAEGRRRIEPVDIAMTCGAGGENLPNNRAMLEALRAHGCRANLSLVADAHTWTCWRDSVGAALERVLRGEAMGNRQ